MFDIELDEGNPSMKTLKLPYNKTGNSVVMETTEIFYVLFIFALISLLSESIPTSLLKSS